MNTKTTTTMIVAMIAMIGMTGLAMAGSTDVVYTGDGSYNMNYNGAGTGSFGIHTYTSYGDDHMEATFGNTNIAGSQEMKTGSTWTKVTRDITVGTGGWGQDASGTIATDSIDNAPNADGDIIYTRATYHDDIAWSSHVQLSQTVKMSDSGINENVSGKARISGHAYGDDTLVTGVIGAITEGNYKATVEMRMALTEGHFDMEANVYARDPTNAGEKTELYNIDNNAWGVHAPAEGTACFLGDGYKVKHDLTITADAGTIHTYGTAHGPDVYIPSTFDNNYNATGYIYALEV